MYISHQGTLANLHNSGVSKSYLTNSKADLSCRIAIAHNSGVCQSFLTYFKLTNCYFA